MELSDETKKKLEKLDKTIETVTLKDMFPEIINEDGLDISLMSAKEMRNFVLYCETRKVLKQKYPCKIGGSTDVYGYTEEDDNDKDGYDIDINKAREDPKASLFLKTLDIMKAVFDKMECLQHLASDYEKYCLRFYWHMVWNWEKLAKDLRTIDVYEVTEAYFKIMRKYDQPVFEEPYYFLDPKQKGDLLFEAKMFKRTSNFSDNEIHVSIIEDFQ